MLEDMNFPTWSGLYDYYKPMKPGLEGFGTKKYCQRAMDSRFGDWVCPLWGSRLMGLRWLFAAKISTAFKGSLSQVRRTLITRPEKAGYQLNGANGATAIRRRLAHFTIASYFKEGLYLWTASYQNQNPHFLDKAGQLIPGFIREKDLMIGDSLTADTQEERAGIDGRLV